MRSPSKTSRYVINSMSCKGTLNGPLGFKRQIRVDPQLYINEGDGFFGRDNRW